MANTNGGDFFQTDGRNEKITFRSGTMDRQTFISTKPLDNINKYIVGYLKDREIHASLVKGMIQMRPSFSYFDKSDKRNKAEQKAENEADLDEEEPKQVTVKFARNDNDRSKKAREKSFNYMTQKSAEEPWCQTMFYPHDTTEAELERQKLFSATNEATGHALSLKSSEYIESLIPPENQHCSLDARVISMNKLKTLPLSDQIQNILKDSKVVSYSKLLELLDLRRFSQKQVRSETTPFWVFDLNKFNHRYFLTFTDRSSSAAGGHSHTWQLGGAIGKTLSCSIGIVHKWCSS